MAKKGKKKITNTWKYTSLGSVLQGKYGLVLTYIGGFAIYASTDFTTTSAILHPPSGRMLNPVVVTHEWLLIMGIWLIAFGFIAEFTKNLSPENKFCVALISLWPLLLLMFS